MKDLNTAQKLWPLERDVDCIDNANLKALYDSVLQTTDRSNPYNSVVKPLLVISFRGAITRDRLDNMAIAINGRIRNIGWSTIVVDGMDEAKVQAFGVDAPLLSELSLDSVIELLEGLKRLKEAQPI